MSGCGSPMEAERRGEELQIETLRRKTGWERIGMASDLFECLKALNRSGIRSQHPDWTEE